MSPAPRIATVVMNRWGILPGVMSSLIGKTAVVTGGSRGIGLAIARALVTSDVNVVITGTNEARLERAGAELRAMARGQKADVRDHGDGEPVLAAAPSRLSGTDILINNAGTV